MEQIDIMIGPLAFDHADYDAEAEHLAPRVPETGQIGVYPRAFGSKRGSWFEPVTAHLADQILFSSSSFFAANSSSVSTPASWSSRMRCRPL